MSDLLNVIVKAVDEKLGSDIEILDFRGVSPFQDYFVIASALNNRMAKSIADNVEDKVYEAGYSVKSIEGDENSSWILIDCYGVVVHIFVGADRQIYSLERLWADLPRVEL